MKPKRRTFILKVILKGRRVPDFGIGKGVLQIAEFSFIHRKSNGPLFAAEMINYEQVMVRELIRFKWEEKR